MFRLIVDKKFKADLDKLDSSLRDVVLKKVLDLETFPELGKRLVGVDLWSLRIGKYRVLYQINHATKEILVLVLDHRKRIYKRL